MHNIHTFQLLPFFLTVYILHNLLKFDSKTTLQFNASSKHTYEITRSEDDIYEFYNAIDIYDVSKEDNRITVKVDKHIQLRGHHPESDFTITFSNDDGKRVAQFEVKP